MVSKDDDPRRSGGYAKAKARKEAGEKGVRLVFQMHEKTGQAAEDAQDELVRMFGPERAYKISESVIKTHGGGSMDRIGRLFKKRR